MRSGRGGFTLIEVMLAVAIFAFAVVGFGRALNDVLGVNSEILRTAQRRQAIESVAAQILAISNNFAPAAMEPVPGWGSEKTWVVARSVQPVLLNLPANGTVPAQTLAGWWQIDVQTQDPQGRPLDRIALLLWNQR